MKAVEPEDHVQSSPNTGALVLAKKKDRTLPSAFVVDSPEALDRICKMTGFAPGDYHIKGSLGTGGSMSFEIIACEKDTRVFKATNPISHEIMYKVMGELKAKDYRSITVE